MEITKEFHFHSFFMAIQINQGEMIKLLPISC